MTKKPTRRQIKARLSAAGLSIPKVQAAAVALPWMADEHGNSRAENIFGKYEVLKRDDGYEAWSNSNDIGLYTTEDTARQACTLHFESCLCLLLRRGIGAEAYVFD